MLIIWMYIYHLVIHFSLLVHLHSQWILTGIDPVQIQENPVRNRIIPVLQNPEERKQRQFLLNNDIPILDQISFGDGWSATWTVEARWTWNGTVEAICNNQYNVFDKEYKFFSTIIITQKWEFWFYINWF